MVRYQPNPVWAFSMITEGGAVGTEGVGNECIRAAGCVSGMVEVRKSEKRIKVVAGQHKTATILIPQF